MKESAIQRQIVEWLRDHGFLVWKISDRFRSGIPDLYAARDGHSHWFEVKRPGEAPTPLQRYEMVQLQNHGVPACVVSSVEQVRFAIEESACQK